MRQLCQVYTGNQQSYSVRYSPFDSRFIACASNDNFGINGSSSLFILEYIENDIFASKFTVNDSLRFPVSIFDVDWSPIDRNLLVTGNGDGSIAVWRWPRVSNDLNSLPYVKTQKHEKEVYNVQWETTGSYQYHFLSVSWDRTIKLWNIGNGQVVDTSTIIGHESIVYSASWNPKNIGLVLSVSADKTFSLWDTKSSNIQSMFTSNKASTDLLTCDWSKHDANIFALGYASGLIEIRDLRNLRGQAVKTFDQAHDYAVRKIKFSPHLPYLFGSVSYDMTTKLWSPSQGLIEQAKNHTEFAYGFDFDPKIPNRVCDSGWDRKVVISEFKIPKM